MSDDRLRSPRSARPRWRVRRHIEGLVALGLLAPGAASCAGRSSGGDLEDMPSPDIPREYSPNFDAVVPHEYSPNSDPVGEPARQMPLPPVNAEAAWLNGRQLVVHVWWAGPKADAAGVTPSGSAPVFLVDSARVAPTEGVVPHLSPVAPAPPGAATSAPAPPAPAPPPPPTGPNGPPVVVAEPVGKEPGHFWFLVRGLGGSKSVILQLVLDSLEGPITTALSVDFGAVGGLTNVRVTSR
ncbi:MAG: hypothetical protein U0414_26930 [Polyangiaceae bacterium]